jgi:hypothetical protein
MEASSEATPKKKHAIKRLAERLNFKADTALQSASSLNDEALVAKASSTRRAVSSAVFGTVANSVVAVACPPFLGAAAVDMW